MALKIFNILKANAEIAGADAAITPALATAGITVIKVEGKDVPAGEAPLAAKISALLAVAPPGASTQQISDVLLSNDALSKQLETVTAENVLNKASAQALTTEKATLNLSLTTANASVNALTASNADLANRNKIAGEQFAAKQGELIAVNRDISRLCVSANCLELVGEDGKPLAKDATDEQKLAAADKVPVADKLKAFSGAVNAAMAKTGLSFATLPTGAPNGQQADKKPMTATEKCRADVEARTKNGTLSLPAGQR